MKRYWFAGPKTGSVEMVLDNLPGYPDNINLRLRRQLLAGAGRHALPGARSRLAHAGLPAPHGEAAAASTNGSSPTSIPAASSSSTSAARSWKSLWDLGGVNHPMITSMREHRGHLYLGGIQNNRIGRYTLARRRSRFRAVRCALGAARMIAALGHLADRLLGRGEAVDHGAALRRPAQAQPAARARPVLAELEAPEDPPPTAIRSSSPTVARCCGWARARRSRSRASNAPSPRSAASAMAASPWRSRAARSPSAAAR